MDDQSWHANRRHLPSKVGLSRGAVALHHRFQRRLEAQSRNPVHRKLESLSSSGVGHAFLCIFCPLYPRSRGKAFSDFWQIRERVTIYLLGPAVCDDLSSPLSHGRSAQSFCLERPSRDSRILTYQSSKQKGRDS